MSDLQDIADTKAKNFTECVTSRKDWNLDDELMCQVFGFTMYGYIFGVGRLTCFMDAEEINAIAIRQLVGLGIGLGYADGLVKQAHRLIASGSSGTTESDLLEVGYSHFASNDVTPLVESIFSNTQLLKGA